jgi:hypothetical protein
MTNLGGPSGPLDPVTHAAVVSALRRGKMIEAIKIYRAATGAHLVDAKNAVEYIQNTDVLAIPPPGRPSAAARGDRPTVMPGLIGALVATLIVLVVLAFLVHAVH